jgi:class 3 adenylate cyclase
MEPTVNEEALERALAALESARSWSPRVVSRLEHHVRTAPDEQLFRLNPLTWASERGVDEYEAVDLFLHSAKAGLVDIDWNVICPCCGKVLRSLRELHGLQAQNTCPVCFRKDQSTLDDLVQVTFTVSPAVRPIRFHHPETLSLDEFCFTYVFEPSARSGGVLAPRDTMRLFKKHLSMFSPGERITVETQADEGVLSCVDISSQHSFGLLVQGDPIPDVQRIAVTFTDDGFEVPLPEADPGEFSVGPRAYAGTFYHIRPGPVAIEFEHHSSARTALAVIYFGIFGLKADLALPGGEVIPGGFDPSAAQMIDFASMDFATPPLTAKRLFATQTFHDLFRADTFGESQGFGVKDVTILFTDLKGSTQLYQREGDLNAYALVREHYGILSDAVAGQHGAVIKTIGDAIMATFNQPAEAVAAGLEMLREVPRMNKSAAHGDLILKVGVHRGAAISVTLNDRVDYFGQTVNIASRVQGSADGGEMLLTEEIFNADGVAELLEGSGWRVVAARVPLRGIDEPATVHRVSASA